MRNTDRGTPGETIMCNDCCHMRSMTTDRRYQYTCETCVRHRKMVRRQIRQENKARAERTV